MIGQIAGMDYTIQKTENSVECDTRPITTSKLEQYNDSIQNMVKTEPSKNERQCATIMRSPSRNEELMIKEHDTTTEGGNQTSKSQNDK